MFGPFPYLCWIVHVLMSTLMFASEVEIDRLKYVDKLLTTWEVLSIKSASWNDFSCCPLVSVLFNE